MIPTMLSGKKCMKAKIETSTCAQFMKSWCITAVFVELSLWEEVWQRELRERAERIETWKNPLERRCTCTYDILYVE